MEKIVGTNGIADKNLMDSFLMISLLKVNIDLLLKDNSNLPSNDTIIFHFCTKIIKNQSLRIFPKLSQNCLY
jgi:hypothetical protein